MDAKWARREWSFGGARVVGRWPSGGAVAGGPGGDFPATKEVGLGGALPGRGAAGGGWQAERQPKEHAAAGKELSGELAEGQGGARSGSGAAGGGRRAERRPYEHAAVGGSEQRPAGVEARDQAAVSESGSWGPE
ncbi:glycine-rich protein DOT1-like [Cryptomeria japonica]|uniref:glycine-rich protein DOT1-like n=1 Tax=Cryptomeria japonica TaxID=3369 RepID=UPI0027DA8D3F|nr:glycine-rich protein DOT1-like [Cryptomeria japonica]